MPVAIALAVLAGPASADGAAPSLRALSRAFRCEIVDRLTRIAAGDSATSKGRFIAISPTSRPDAYVQCIFVEHEAALFCEAASGAYDPRDAEGRRGLPPGDPARLAELGFTAESPDKNLARRVPLGRDGDLGPVANLMLRALHDGFGVVMPVTLTIRAPHGQRPRGTQPVCEAPAVS